MVPFHLARFVMAAPATFVKAPATYRFAPSVAIVQHGAFETAHIRPVIALPPGQSNGGDAIGAAENSSDIDVATDAGQVVNDDGICRGERADEARIGAIQQSHKGVCIEQEVRGYAKSSGVERGPSETQGIVPRTCSGHRKLAIPMPVLGSRQPGEWDHRKQGHGPLENGYSGREESDKGGTASVMKVILNELHLTWIERG